MEDVDSFHCCRALLLIAEDQVDPLVQVGAHVVTLQSLGSEVNRMKNILAPRVVTDQRSPAFPYLTVDSDELSRVSLCPGW